MTTLYNGITLPAPWPPRDRDPLSRQPMSVPYLDRPPAVIPIDTGRQLFVDDFLIADSSLVRVHHQPVKSPANPLFFPQTEWERNADLPPCTIPKCGGVWYDGRTSTFRMWYMASYLGVMAYAESEDGVHWIRPRLDIVEGTNLILPPDIHPDSGTVFIDTVTSDDSARYKMLIREPNPPNIGSFPARLFTSPDGLHWHECGKTGIMDDRSTMFYNPFRDKWVHSIRAWIPPVGRTRLYWEHEDFLRAADWQQGEPPFWVGADCLDEAGQSPPQLYNLDAVAYESLMIGFLQILKGPPNQNGEAVGMPKLTELTIAYSRDGFHWHRPMRTSFIGALREGGSWEYGYVESTGGVCVIVGDEVWFYYSAYAGDHTRISADWRNSGTYANGAVGLAKLRRDGFASLRAGVPGASVLTRPVTFSGRYLHVNANTAGAELRAEVTDEHGQVLPGYSRNESIPFVGNSTCARLQWREQEGLESLAGRSVRLRFSLDRGELFAFWISATADGASGGYPAAGCVGSGQRRI